MEQNETQTFTPPRHWRGPEELEASYWADEAAREKRAQEFFDKPVETIDMIDRIDKAGVARREFLTIMGASMAMAGMSCARRPVHKIIPYVVKPAEITPGVANWYASSYVEGGEVMGLLVKTREGRPIKLEGNPDHPINKGVLSARAQASVLSLYDPDRVTAPVFRDRNSGSRKPVSWQDLDTEVVLKLKAAASRGARVKILTGEVVSESQQKLIQILSGALRGAEHVQYEPLAAEDVSEGQALSYGSAVVPRYNFKGAEAILSLGADFLGTWISPTEFAREWARSRKLEGQTPGSAKQSRLFVVESVMSTTGANADERIGVRSGDELKVAMALAHEIIVAKKRSRYASDGAVGAALMGASIESVAQELAGIEKTHALAARMREMAEALWESRGKSLVVAGGPSAQGERALGLQVVANLLNSALENEGKTVDGGSRATPARTSFAKTAKLVQDMAAGRVDILITARTNPAYTFPGKTFAEASKKVPLIIAITDREDETALLADVIVPESHDLESWGDAAPRKGVWSLIQPTISPIHGTRSFSETLLAWGKGLGAGGVGSVKDGYEWVRQYWRDTVQRQAGGSGAFESFWEASLQRGGVFTEAGAGGARSFKTAALSAVPKYTPKASEHVLAVYSSIMAGDGRFANNPWLQELPDPISSVTWDNYIGMAPETAKRLGITQDDVVEVSTQAGKFELPVHVQPGLHKGSLAVAVGYGRTAAGKVGSGAGVSMYGLARVQGDRAVFSGLEAQVRKTGKRYRLATTQWHTSSENRPVLNDITLAEFRKNPATSAHTDPHLRMDPVPSLWPKHEYKGHRWGMAIDLTSCIGCGACMVACQAENNIPVVGREQVRNSRQMHWIRIDRYYSGAPENPDVVFQPMLCQHCENAPCETVCPVLATMHDNEGVNVQVYNRCVGTRYCQNNCPYKVRRFNFFDHWVNYESTMNLAWNPDVTVRTRGIMEKCTFCIQRVRDEKDKAKTKGEKLTDGKILTACQQTCPTDAIVFGDINDPTTRVSKLKNSPQAFRVLEVLNTKPAVSYLTKVRNKEKAEGGAHHG